MPSRNLSISTDRQHRMDGLTRIWDEDENAYVTGPDGTVLTFTHPHKAGPTMAALTSWGESISPHAVGKLWPKTRALLAAGVRMGTINGDTGRQHAPARSHAIADWLSGYEQESAKPAPIVEQSGHYRQDGYACEECGYSAFHYSSEFRDGVEGDLTRVCADCGHIDTETAEQYRDLRLAATETEKMLTADPNHIAAMREAIEQGTAKAAEDPREFAADGPADGITAEIGTSGRMQTLALDGRASVDISAAVGAEHADMCDDASCDIDRALEDGFPFWAATLLQSATEVPLLDAVVSHYCGAGMDWREVSERDRVDWLASPTWTEHAYKCNACGSVTFGDEGWAPEQCANCLADDISPMALEGFDVDGFVNGYIEAALWADCMPYDPRERIAELRAEVAEVYARGVYAPERQLIELSNLAELLDDETGELLDTEQGGREGLSVSDETRAELAEDCRDFIAANRADLDAYCEQRAFDPSQGSVASYAGHDFWLTRAGHGAGFWARDLGELGERLSEAAKVYGEGPMLADMGNGSAEIL